MIFYIYKSDRKSFVARFFENLSAKKGDIFVWHHVASYRQDFEPSKKLPRRNFSFKRKLNENVLNGEFQPQIIAVSINHLLS